MKLKNAVTMKQEKLLGEKEQLLQNERLELTNVKHALKIKEEEVVLRATIFYKFITTFVFGYLNCILQGTGRVFIHIVIGVYLLGD